MADKLITIKPSPGSMARVKRLLADDPKARNRVYRRAASNAARQMQSLGRKEIRKATKLQGRYINDMIQRFNPPKAAIAIAYINKGAIIPIKKMAWAKTPEGITYITPELQEKDIPSAFMSQKLGGHIFTRVGDSRFPLRKQFHQVAGEEILPPETIKTISQNMKKLGWQTLRKEILRLTQVELDKKAGK